MGDDLGASINRFEPEQAVHESEQKLGVGNLLRELIDIESVTGNESAITAFIREAMPDSYDLVYDDDSVLFFRPHTFEEYRPESEHESTDARRPGRAELVVLAGHTDTVPVEANLPSSMSGDTIFGRGACDMKGGLAAMISLAHSLALTAKSRQGADLTNSSDPEQTAGQAFHPLHEVGFLFFGREEGPISNCPLFAALEKIQAVQDATLAILMEPTGGALEAGCQGALRFEVTFDGVAAHAARPWLGDNAAHKAILALSEIAISEPVDIETQGLTFREVASVVGLQSGVAGNVIPPSATAKLNIRYAPVQEPDAVERLWVDKLGSLGASVRVEDHAPCARVVTRHPVIDALTAAGAGPIRGKQAWTNVADFSRLRIPAINFGPGDPAFAHRSDEQIKISSVLHVLNVLEEALGGRADAL